MIDLLSTRNVDEQTRACARLLAAVIAQAVQDAAIPFGTVVINDKLVYESKNKRNLNPVARSAVRWLFFSDSVFPLYASMIGLNAESIRHNLLSHRYESNRLLSSEQRNIIRTRLRFEQNDPGPFEEIADADDAGVQPEAEGSRGGASPGERGADMAPKSRRNSSKVPKSRRK